MPEELPKFNEGISEAEKLSVQRKNAFLKEFLSRKPTQAEQKLHQNLATQQQKAFSKWGGDLLTTGSQFTPFANHWKPILLDKEGKRFAPAFFGKLSESLKNDTLVDLGGSVPASAEEIGGITVMPRIAREVGVSKYITVDDSCLMTDKSSVDHVIQMAGVDMYKYTDTSDTEVLAIKADMLDFVSRVGDNSANFVLNGIDYNVIPEQKYRDELVKHIARATKIGGLVWGNQSVIIEYLSKDKNFERVGVIPEEGYPYEMFCFKKIA